MNKAKLPLARLSFASSGSFASLAAFVGLTALAACGGGNENLPPPPPPPPPPPMPSAVATTPPPPPVEDAGKPAPVTPATLTAGTAAADPAAPLPTVKVLAPAKGQVIAAKDAAEFAIKLDVKNWKTETGSSHVHLIVDNRPYKAIYDPKKPVKLSELFGGDAIEEGQHVIVAFPSRATHESVKTKGALTVTDFYVGKKGTPTVDLAKPMLIYSRPKGDYKGEMGNHVLVDFQVANVTLAEGKEHVTIAVTGPGIDDKLTASSSKFGTPFYLDNLQNGSYTVKLDLVDGSNAPVAGAWNSTTRKINVDHDATPDPMPGMAMGTAGAAGAGGPDAGAPAATPAAAKPAATPPAAKPAPAPKK